MRVIVADDEFFRQKGIGEKDWGIDPGDRIL